MHVVSWVFVLKQIWGRLATVSIWNAPKARLATGKPVCASQLAARMPIVLKKNFVQPLLSFVHLSFAVKQTPIAQPVRVSAAFVSAAPTIRIANKDLLVLLGLAYPILLVLTHVQRPIAMRQPRLVTP